MSAAPFRAPTASLDDALAHVAAGATARDAAPTPVFPRDALDLLAAAGALAANATPGRTRPSAVGELSLVRRVAAADGSVGRILDGHLNAIERIAVHAPGEVADTMLARVRAGQALLGVWGGDPAGSEGPPAGVHSTGSGEVLRGVKTFCSGAGGLDHALVLARDGATPTGPPVLVLVDLSGTDRIEIDSEWYRSSGLVASVSHRVVFNDAPVTVRLGLPGAIAQQPWFARDALRTAASWAGIADCAVNDALAVLRARPDRGELEALAAGRIAAASHTIDVWLAAAARAMDSAADDLPAVALNGRVAIAGACRTILAEAAAACGARPFATGRPLDRARRDLELFLLQHRLDPLLARAGADILVQPGASQ